MSVLCGWASIDERGKAKGGSAGDQTGKEVKTGNWYNFGQSVVLRFKDRAKAKKAAQTMKILCTGNYVGYDQNQRTTLYTEMQKVGWDASKLKTKCETDCSAMMSPVLRSVGINISKDVYTGNLVQACMVTGEFTKLIASKYTDGSEHLMIGDIMVNPGSHTIMALEDGSKAGTEGSPSSSSSSGTYKAVSWIGKVNTPKGVNVRSTPKVTTTNKIKAITNGTVVEITKESGNWGYANNQGGWVCLDYIKKISGSSSSSGNSSSSGYKAGNIYTLRSNMVVRTGAGKNYRAKTHNELTADGKKHDKNKNGCLDAGTPVTCKAVENVGNAIWIQIPSGWICAKDGSKVYVS